MTKLTKLLLKRQKANQDFFQNYLSYAQTIKKEAEKKLKSKLRVFVFGSILRRQETPQDIDILLISPKFQSYLIRNRVRARLWQKIGFATPFEFHLITPKQYQDWYQFFLKERITI